MNGKDEADAMFAELSQTACGSLSVVVDFMELLNRYDEEGAFEMITKLKDLLA